MLVVHWSPVNNTKRILKDGITKNKNGLYCFPLTGNRYVDKFWVDLLNSKNKKKYNGFLFRLIDSDMPAYFGDWIGATNKDIFDKKIKTLKSMKLEYKNNFLSKLGQRLSHSQDDFHKLTIEDFIVIAEKEIQEESNNLSEILKDIEFLNWSMEHLQIVLSESIKPKRIIKIIGEGYKTGRVKRIEMKDKISKSELNKDML